MLNLGLEVIPDINHFKIHNFNITPSQSIDKGANILAMDLFKKGVEFGSNYQPESDYVILAETIPTGTTKAYATALALGYDVKGKFSSSFKNNPKRNAVVKFSTLR